MEVKRFTGEEMDALRSNPYTYKVTQCQLSFTTGFKELFLKHYNEGMAPRDILLSLGYDPDMLGDNRVNGIRMHIKKEFEKQGRKDFDIILEAYQWRGYSKGAKGIYMRLLHMEPPVVMNVKK